MVRRSAGRKASNRFIRCLLAINLLKNKAAGTFLVRDSQGFPGSYGLAVKVETLPQGIQAKPGLS